MTYETYGDIKSLDEMRKFVGQPARSNRGTDPSLLTSAGKDWESLCEQSLSIFSSTLCPDPHCLSSPGFTSPALCSSQVSSGAHFECDRIQRTCGFEDGRAVSRAVLMRRRILS